MEELERKASKSKRVKVSKENVEKSYRMIEKMKMKYTNRTLETIASFHTAYIVV